MQMGTASPQECASTRSVDEWWTCALAWALWEQGQFTCLKGHLSETYRLRVRVSARTRVRVSVRVSVKFRNLHNSISNKWPFGQVTCNRRELLLLACGTCLPARCSVFVCWVCVRPATCLHCFLWVVQWNAVRPEYSDWMGLVIIMA